MIFIEQIIRESMYKIYLNINLQDILMILFRMWVSLLFVGLIWIAFVYKFPFSMWVGVLFWGLI